MVNLLTQIQYPTMNPIVKSMLKGDKRALSRLMTYVDNRHEDLMSIMSDVYEKSGKAWRIGITGPPGAGKSTLVDKLIARYRSKGKTVGVVAIDPSSPFTGGAVLGDRIRMMDHGSDEGVFIRSLGSRGSHGGLSRATRDVVHLMDAADFDVILIETVGVGQTELDIMSVAHVTVVVLVPESGDTIQTMKAGLMEIADIFAVNKADREGADRIYHELKTLSEIYASAKKIPVFKVEALNNKGVDDLLKAVNDQIKQSQKNMKKNGPLEGLLKDECVDIFLAEVRGLLGDKLTKGGGVRKGSSRVGEKTSESLSDGWGGFEEV